MIKFVCFLCQQVKEKLFNFSRRYLLNIQFCATRKIERSQAMKLRKKKNSKENHRLFIRIRYTHYESRDESSSSPL